MDLLVVMNARLATNRHLVDDLRAEKMAEEESRLQSLSLTRATPGMSRDCTGRRVMIGPRHTDHEPIANITDEA